MLMGYVIKTYSQAPVGKYGCFGCYIEAYQRGVQALLVSTGGQCQSLRSGMSSKTDTHAFLYLLEPNTYYLLTISVGVVADSNKQCL